jgi:hypothetical protein
MFFLPEKTPEHPKFARSSAPKVHNTLVALTGAMNGFRGYIPIKKKGPLRWVFGQLPCGDGVKKIRRDSSAVHVPEHGMQTAGN